jgi:hypothetical protein
MFLYGEHINRTISSMQQITELVYMIAVVSPVDTLWIINKFISP